MRLTNTKLERFEDLTAWQEARKLVKLVYDITAEPSFGRDRDLTRQMRRAAVSAMANIAEGFSRYSFKDSKQFFIISRGSLEELRSHMYIAMDQAHLLEEQFLIVQNTLEVVGKLVSGLIRNSQRRLELSASDRAMERLNN